MPYSRKDLFDDMAENIIRDCSRADEMAPERLKEAVVKRLERMARLVEDGDV